MNDGRPPLNGIKLSLYTLKHALSSKTYDFSGETQTNQRAMATKIYFCNF